MDAPQWLLATGLAMSVFAAVLASHLVDKWVERRLMASARRRALHSPAGELSQSRLRDLSAGLAPSAARAWSSLAVSRYISWPTAATAVGGVVMAAVVAAIFSSVPIGGAVALAIGVGYSHVRRTRSDRGLEELRAQLPQLFTVLASSVGAGLSLPQAFARAEKSCDLPIAGELRTVNSSIALGMPLPEALEQFAKRSCVPELRAVAVGLGIQHTAGGGLVRILEHASHQLRQGEALRRTIRSHTAQGRMTLRMVTVLPVGLAVLLAVLSEDYLAVFTGTPSGQALLGLAIGLEAIGVYTVSRILRVEV